MEADAALWVRTERSGRCRGRKEVGGWVCDVCGRERLAEEEKRRIVSCRCDVYVRCHAGLFGLYVGGNSCFDLLGRGRGREKEKEKKEEREGVETHKLQ